MYRLRVHILLYRYWDSIVFGVPSSPVIFKGWLWCHVCAHSTQIPPGPLASAILIFAIKLPTSVGFNWGMVLYTCTLVPIHSKWFLLTCSRHYLKTILRRAKWLESIPQMRWLTLRLEAGKVRPWHRLDYNQPQMSYTFSACTSDTPWKVCTLCTAFLLLTLIPQVKFLH